MPIICIAKGNKKELKRPIIARTKDIIPRECVSGQVVEGTIYPGWNNKSLFINLVIVGKKRYYEKPIEL